jgi:ribonuclease T1
MDRRAIFRMIAAASLALGLLGIPVAGSARTTPDALPEVAIGELPGEAARVMAAIRSGGPFRYERDGVTFGNRERILPAQPRGYYHEYTVPTPGALDRGARRIVCGGPRKAPDACWYTGDHYQSFVRIRE